MVPARLGMGFRWLLASSWASNLGDGLMVAAGPLLVASQTHNPVLVAGAAMAGQLPWLLFGLVAGALADRLDRRLLVMAVDSLRAVVLAGLCVVIVTGHVDIWLVMVTMFVLGTAEVFADATTGTLAPMLVEKADLGIANARMMAGFVTVNQLVGPAIGAFLFTVGMALPVRRPGHLRRARGGARQPDRHAQGRRPRERRHPRPPGHRRGRALADGQPPGADARAGDRHLQHHLGRADGRCWCCGRSSGSGSRRPASGC